MSLRNIAIFGVVAVLIIAYVAWTRNTEKPAAGVMPQQTQSQAQGEAAMPQGDASAMPPAAAPGEAQPPVIETGTNPGLAWNVPAGWTDQGASSMRLATYVFHGPNNTEAQCAVYYFGPGQGGTVDANLQRWQGEFKDAKSPQRSKLSANGVAVERISMTGTYMAHVGMMGSGSSTESPNWALLGAIAEGPNGSVFFKFTGPEVAVKAAGADFEAMLKSLRKS